MQAGLAPHVLCVLGFESLVLVRMKILEDEPFDEMSAIVAVHNVAP